MALYSFQGVSTLPRSTQGGCCEPVCGPTTCGGSAEAGAEPVKTAPQQAKQDSCCEPECGPSTCP